MTLLAPSQMALDAYDLLAAGAVGNASGGSLLAYELREFAPRPIDDQSRYGPQRFGSWQPKPALSFVQAGINSLA